MGSSSIKKHKKEKKHKHHRSRSRSAVRSRNHEEAAVLDLTGDGDRASYGHKHKHSKHKKHKERKGSKERHRHKHRERENERSSDAVIAVPESDSDSSDCVEVPVDDVQQLQSKATTTTATTNARDKERALEAEALLKAQQEERAKERQREREREHERLREAEKQRERAEERERARERELRERDRERERYRDAERERERDRERYERERYQRDREREHEREKQRDLERERQQRARDMAHEHEMARTEPERFQQHHSSRPAPAEKPQSSRADKQKSASPIPENGAGDVLSVEETNKLRAKLGLAPLQVDSGPISKKSGDATQKSSAAENGLLSYKDEWGEFLHKPAGNLKEKAEAEKLREKLKQRKEKRSLEQRLARIQTLGESDEDVDDVSKWVQRNKRVVDVKKEAEMRAKVLEEMDAKYEEEEREKQQQKQRKAYNDKHLKGLRVEHDVDDFSEGKTVILTLKDEDVLNEQATDTLVNVNMLDEERYKRNVAVKKQNPLNYGYNVYEEQYDQFGDLIERGVLEKYDEDVDGKKEKRKNFVLGDNLELEREQRRKILEIKTKLAGKRLETLADTRIELASDTFTPTEMEQFKKPKKRVKTKRLRQKLKAEDLLPLTDEPTQHHLGSRRGLNRHASTADDDDEDNKEMLKEIKLEEDQEDDLERMLNKARKLKQKENIITKCLQASDAERIKAEIKAELSDAENDDDARSNSNSLAAYTVDGSNITLNATAEFCRTLGDIPTYGMAGNRDGVSNEMMDFELTDDINEDMPLRAQRARDYEEPENNHGTWNSVNPDEINQPIDLDEILDDVDDVPILDEEPDVGAGVGNALRLALSKGYLEKEEHNRPSNTKMAHLQAKNYSIEDKSGEDDKPNRRDRFYGGPIMDFKDKDNFKPNVKLEYIDDNGRILSSKEAFRYLSHKFHGKGPSKNKLEKRLKKMEQEGLMKTMSSTDTPLGTLTMLQQKQKDTHTPYVVLSGGKQTLLSSGIGTGLSNTTISKTHKSNR